MDERTRDWRRFKNQINERKGMGSSECWKPEKNWKMIYLRSAKLARAKQLGIEYPRLSMRQLLDKECQPIE